MSSACSVSVIMPVYNSEDYVADAAASVLRESTADMELILVDDGSTDGSGAICDRLAGKDPRVRAIHEGNAGMCHARNVGIRAARGEWVTFVDNDDEVLPGFVDDNLAMAKRYDADVVRFGRRMLRVDDSGKVVRTSDFVPAEERIVAGDQLRADLRLAHDAPDGVWAGLYRSSMLLEHGITFPEDFRSGAEDIWFNDQVIRTAGSCAFNPRVYYMWKRRVAHSTSMRLSENKVMSLSKTLDLEWSIMQDFGAAKSDPTWCSDRLFLLVRDVLSLGTYGGWDKEDEAAMFMRVRRLLEPYLRFMRSHLPSGVAGVLFKLLDTEHYGLLSKAISGGGSRQAGPSEVLVMMATCSYQGVRVTRSAAAYLSNGSIPCGWRFC